MTLFCSCGQHASKYDPPDNKFEKNQTESPLAEITSDQKTEKNVGEDLFRIIMDTIKMDTITVNFLINNRWIFKPFDNCESYLKFQENGKGISYNCELEEDYEMTYKIQENKVFIAEYEIPHVDNEERKKIKYRDDTYVFNGHSLIMVNSRMYNIGGREWTPEIEVVINYEKKK